MLNLLDQPIVLNKPSWAFWRIAVIIYGLTFTVLLCSAWVILVKFCIALLLFLTMLHITIKPIPYPHYSHLSYVNSNWILHQVNGKKFHYKHLRVVINTGLFFLLQLSNESHTQCFVIFLDQISQDTYRQLKLCENFIQKN